MRDDVEESILDLPRKEGLDGNLWRLSGDGKTYVLQEDARNKIMFVIKWMTQNELHPLETFGVNLVGSMTSNSYSDSSDIDLHFNSEEILDSDAEEFQKTFKNSFENEFKKIFPEEDWTIGGHPIEVYFQPNPIQDLMSVGCYDVLNQTWKVGPEFKSAEYDPYAEYYGADMDLVDGVIGSIRNVILECYESAVVISKSKDRVFQGFELKHFKDSLERAAGIFQKAREFRKRKSAPRSEEEARIFRNSKDWKIADSAFKLLDKFGYLGILRTMTQCHEKLQTGETTESECVPVVIKAIRDNFSGNRNLDESQRLAFEELQNEGLKDVAKYAMLMGLLASPVSGLNGAQKDAAIEKNVPRRQLDVLQKKIGNLTYQELQNLLAWTLWTEARGEFRKNGLKSLNAVASVIWNRANGDREHFADVVSKPKQFSWWNDYDGGFQSGTYVQQSPSEKELKNPENSRIWNFCNNIAVNLLEGNFRSTIGNYNSYLNKNTADKENVESWGKECDLRIGNHWFGYQREWDGSRKYGDKADKTQVAKQEKTHVIKPGDTIGKIAKTYNTTVKDILAKNSFIKNADKIRIGQKIRI